MRKSFYKRLKKSSTHLTSANFPNPLKVLYASLQALRSPYKFLLDDSKCHPKKRIPQISTKMPHQ